MAAGTQGCGSTFAISGGISAFPQLVKDDTAFVNPLPLYVAIIFDKIHILIQIDLDLNVILKSRLFRVFGEIIPFLPLHHQQDRPP